MPELYVIATPIGNLEDVSNRALRILKEVDFILCEDTRVTKKLLAHYKINTKTISYHQHSSDKKLEEIIKLLQDNKNLALVTDAGTPGISDPGNELIAKIVEQMGSNVNIVPIPGPSALSSIASICGFPMNKFIFLGFPPKKNKRKKYFKEMLNQEYPVIFFESGHRIIKTLNEISEIAAQLNNEYDIVVGRELTKKFETIYRGSIDEVLRAVEADTQKGEFSIVISKIKN